MNAIKPIELEPQALAQVSSLAEETKQLGHDLIAEDLHVLATVSPPVVSDLLNKVLTSNLPVDLGSPCRQLVDVIRELREILEKARVSEQAA